MRRKFFFFFNILLVFVFILTPGCTHVTPVHQFREAESSEASAPFKAIRIYEDILSRSTSPLEQAEAHYKLGRLLLREGRPEAADEHFKAAVELAPDSDWGIGASIERIGRDTSLATSEKYTRLQACMTRTARASIQDRAAFYLAEMDYRNARWADALKRLKQAATLRQTDGYTYWLRIGTCESRLKQFSFAERDLKKAEGLNFSHNPSVWLELSEVYLKTGRQQKALETLLSAEQLHPNPVLEVRLESMLQDIPESLLEEISMNYPDGSAGYLIARERLMRMLVKGDLEKADQYVENMRHRFPGFSGDLSRIAADLEKQRQVRGDRIGILAPVSGPLSGIGYSVYRGARLAAMWFRQTYPMKSVELVVKDTAGLPEKAVEGFRELMEEDKVLAVLGPVRSDTVNAIAPETVRWRCPVITPGCPRNGVISQSPYLYRIYPSPYKEAYILTRYLITYLGLTKFACVYPDATYGREAFEGLKKALQEFNGNLVFKVSYSPQASTFNTLLTGLKDLDIDVILIPDQANRAALVAGQIRYQEVLEPIIVGTGGWDDPDLLQIAGPHLEGSFFITGYPLSSPRRTEIQNAYIEQFGEKPDLFALRSFEATYILLQGIGDGMRYREQIQYALQSGTMLPALDDTARFSSAGDLLPPFTIFLIHKGMIQPRFRWIDGTFEAIPQDEEPLSPLFPTADETTSGDSPRDQSISPADVLSDSVPSPVPSGSDSSVLILSTGS